MDTGWCKRRGHLIARRCSQLNSSSYQRRSDSVLVLSGQAPVESRPGPMPLPGAYVDPAVAGIEFKLPPVGPPYPPAKDADPDELGPQPGWYALSVNKIRDPTRAYEYFLQFRPVATAGYSIYIYHISPEEANGVRHSIGLAELSASGSSP